MPRWVRHDGHVIATDPGLLDLDAVHAVLRESYWSPGIPRETFERAVEHSIVFGLYASDGSQAGFARVVSDHATFAYLADVYVADRSRGRGLGAWLVECVLAHPELQGLRRWSLATRDAHDLYARFGFSTADPEIHMTLERSPAELWGR
jgi:GNAT superfamily N-acetyltransferase